MAVGIYILTEMKLQADEHVKRKKHTFFLYLLANCLNVELCKHLNQFALSLCPESHILSEQQPPHGNIKC